MENEMERTMNAEIKNMVDAKLSLFGKHIEVPADKQPEYESLVAEIKQLGECCSNWQDFEKRFETEGLSARYNSLIAGCTPIAQENTNYFQGFNKNFAKGLAKETVKNMVSGASTELESEMIAQNRKRMIEDGTYTDYTHASNAINSTSKLFGFLSKKLRKK